MRSFDTVLKDMTASSVHVPSADDNKKGKAKPFKAILSEDKIVTKVIKLGVTDIFKIDEGEGIVYGWAIVSKVDGKDYFDLNIDHSGPRAGERVPENVPEDALAKCALGFVDAGAPGNEMHAGPDRGDFPFVMPMTTELYQGLFGKSSTPPKTGLIVGHRPTPEVLQKFKNGEYSGFSIEGARLDYTEHNA